MTRAFTSDESVDALFLIVAETANGECQLKLTVGSRAGERQINLPPARLQGGE